MSQELLNYPEGEGDAVPIAKRDMAELQPGRFLGNEIVDFYIRYLERRLSREHANRFHFFKSFFFTKLLQSKSDYKQLRNWTEGVNLFTKDYVFIPILKSSHWSLIILCHLSSLTRPPGEMMRSPCVYHLDPMKGQHESFEGFIRSYVLQAWMERFQASSNSDQILALCQMKYVQAKVPQQDNSHDCGLYVLNYVEAFLAESTSSDFSFTSNEKGSDFLHPHFVPEVSGKRRDIRNLIHQLHNISRKRKFMDMVSQFTQNVRSLGYDEGIIEACMKVVNTIDPSPFNGQGFDNALDVQCQQSTWISKGVNESLDSLEIGHREYENKSGSLSLEHQHVELEHEVQAMAGTNFSGPLLEAKHVSTHEGAMVVQHELSSGISRMNYEVSNGLEPSHVQHSRVSEIIVDQMEQPNPKEIACMDLFEVGKGESKRSKIMTKDVTTKDVMTQKLLSCKLDGDRFCKGSRGATDWDLIREVICEEIGEKLGSWPSADQCRRRYDTLLKAYNTYKKYCGETGKTFLEFTVEERRDMKLSTTLSEEWFVAMDKICNKANIYEKSMKMSSNACNGMHPLKSLELRASNAPQISQGAFQNEVLVLDDGLCKVIPLSTLSSLNEDLQSTLLNLVQECLWFATMKMKREFYLGEACRRLAILQDRERRDILSYVLKLWELQLVHVIGMSFEEAMDMGHIDFLKGKRGSFEFSLYKKIVDEVVCKNLKFQTHLSRFPFKKSSLHHIKVLRLSMCLKLEYLDLREFPSLQCLSLVFCPKLNLVIGWEVAIGIGLLEIVGCRAYLDIPKVQYLSSLRDFNREGWDSNESIVPWQLSEMRQCTKLQRLHIWCSSESSLEIVNVEILRELKFLESLSLENCDISSILDLNGFQALTTLSFMGSESLKRILGLGSLKGLTHLCLNSSGVEDIEGVGELELLTRLDLYGCRSLKQLPCLGQLRVLVYLDLRHTSVKEIVGKEGLISCKPLL